MSHIVTIKCKLTDPVAVTAACQRLNLPAPEHGTAEALRRRSHRPDHPIARLDVSGGDRPRDRKRPMRHVRRQVEGVGMIPPLLSVPVLIAVVTKPRRVQCHISSRSKPEFTIRSRWLAACRRLRLAEPIHGSVRLFSGEASGLSVKLPGWQYPVVVDTAEGSIKYDNYEGRWGDPAELQAAPNLRCREGEARSKEEGLLRDGANPARRQHRGPDRHLIGYATEAINYVSAFLLVFSMRWRIAILAGSALLQSACEVVVAFVLIGPKNPAALRRRLPAVHPASPGKLLQFVRGRFQFVRPDRTTTIRAVSAIGRFEHSFGMMPRRCRSWLTVGTLIRLGPSECGTLPHSVVRRSDVSSAHSSATPERSSNGSKSRSCSYRLTGRTISCWLS